MFQIDEELVFWQWKASLNVVDGLGNPVRLPDNARLYFQNGFGHIGASGLLAPPQPAGLCQHLTKGLGASGSPPQRWRWRSTSGQTRDRAAQEQLPAPRGITRS